MGDQLTPKLTMLAVIGHIHRDSLKRLQNIAHTVLNYDGMWKKSKHRCHVITEDVIFICYKKLVRLDKLNSLFPSLEGGRRNIGFHSNKSLKRQVVIFFYHCDINFVVGRQATTQHLLNCESVIYLTSNMRKICI